MLRAFFGRRLALSLALVSLFGLGLGASMSVRAESAPAKPAPEKPAPEKSAPEDPCAAKKFSYPQVEKACKEGGRKAAKDLMKAVVKKAKDAGKDIKCNACHTSLKTFELEPNAVEDLKPLL